MSHRLTSNHFPKWIDVSWVKQQTHNLTQMNSGLQWSRKQNSVEWNLLTCRSEILQTVSLKYKNDTVEVGAYPISHRARDKAHPGQVSMERQPFMLTFTLMAPVTVMVWEPTQAQGECVYWWIWTWDLLVVRHQCCNTVPPTSKHF